MLRIFTNPTNVQNYVADPITSKFMHIIKSYAPELIDEVGTDYIRFYRDERIAKVLTRLMRKQSGFKIRSSEHFLSWTMRMKDSAQYSGNRLIISLIDDGFRYKFSTRMVHGKYKRQVPAPLFPGVISVLSFITSIFILPSGLENDTMSFLQFFIAEAISIAIGVIFYCINEHFCPMYDEDDSED